MVASGLLALPPHIAAPAGNSTSLPMLADYRPPERPVASLNLVRVCSDGGLVSVASNVSRIFSMVNGFPQRRLLLA